MHARRGLVLLFLLTLVGCAAPGPRFASVVSGIPPLAPGQARIYAYRWLEPYETNAPTKLSLNGQPVGVTEPGAVLYRDVAPGQYTISVGSWGIYPNQFKTVVLRPGETAYVRIESLRSWCNDSGGGSQSAGSSGCYDTFVVEIVAPAAARAEMADLRFIRG